MYKAKYIDGITYGNKAVFASKFNYTIAISSFTYNLIGHIVT